MIKTKKEDIIENAKSGILRKFPLLGATLSNLKFEPTAQIQTAATDGERVLYNEEFISSLTPEQRIFVFSHEIMHVAFNHILRSKGKDAYIWNIATDAVINQMLKNENLPIIDGGVDIIEAVNKSAEEMYEKLYKKKQQEEKAKQQSKNNSQQQQDNSQSQPNQGQSENQNKQQQDNNQSQQQNQEQTKNGQQNGNMSQNKQSSQQNSQNNTQNDNQSQQNSKKEFDIDNHTLWEEAVNKADELEEERKKTEQENKTPQKSGESQNQQEQKQEQNKNQETPQEQEVNEQEKQFGKKNKELKERIAKEIIERLKGNKLSSKSPIGASEGYFGDVGEAKAVVSWKRILRKELEKEEDRWSYRRADEENDFQARIGSLEVLERPETQVLLDTSGSISDSLLRGFLRQLKPLLKESKLYVGCFDTNFYGFTEIKTKKDIDNYHFKGRGGTSFDLALKSFSKDKKINKIIFTDGYDTVTNSQENRKMKVIWIVYDNKNFKPCCGKVINVNSREMYFMKQESESEEFTQ